MRKIFIFFLILNLAPGCQKASSSNHNKNFLIVEAMGYAGPIKVRVEFSEDKSIAKVEVLSHQETPTYIKDELLDTFLKQFKGLKTESHPLTGIDAISGATVTCDAILRAVERAVHQKRGDKARPAREGARVLRALRKAGLKPYPARYWKVAEGETKGR